MGNATGEAWVFLTADRKADLVAEMETTKNCETIEKRSNDMATLVCHMHLQELKAGGAFQPRLSAVLYLAANAAVVIPTFFALFGAFFLLLTLSRRYWHWLNS
ncbi:MAG: hypothetical protein ACXWKC_20965 [Xanthobacteraceae bacterium]